MTQIDQDALTQLLQDRLAIEPDFLSQFDNEADALPVEVQVRRFLLKDANG